MKISVIVPFLNEERYIEQCVQALEIQEFPRQEYEVIFVDNGSRDRSSALVSRSPHVRLLHEPQRGAHAARNRGLEVAQGEVIAFTDADCAPAKNWLRQIWEGMQRTHAMVVLGKRQLPCGFFWPGEVVADYENAKIQRLLREGPTPCVFAYTNNMAVRRDVMQAVGSFAPWPGAEDVEWIQRCLARFRRDQVVYLEDMVVLHLEVTGLHVWLKKRWVYGNGLNRLERETAYRVLTHRQQIRSYHDYLELSHYSWKQKMALGGVLTAGFLCFKLGESTISLPNGCLR